MFNWELFPWTDFRGVNLDWIINQLKGFTSKINANTSAISAESAARASADSELQRQLNSIPGVAPYPTIITVAKSGGQYNTINAAINHAKTYAKNTNRVAIVIDGGTYIEDIDLIPNPGIDLFGFGTTIQSASTGYPHTALYTAGQGFFRGITFVGTSTYAVHVEVQGHEGQTSGLTLFDNCQFYATANSALGAGLGQYCSMRCKNCLFNTPAGVYGAYVHNYPGADSPVTCEFDNCNFSTGGGGALKIDDSASMFSPGSVASMVISIRNCTAYTDGANIVEFRKTNDGVTYKGVLTGTNIFFRDCHGNNADSLTYMQGQAGLSQGVATLYMGKYRCVVPSMFNPRQTRVNITSLNISGVGVASGYTGASMADGTFLIEGAEVATPAGDLLQSIDCVANYTIDFIK